MSSPINLPTVNEAVTLDWPGILVLADPSHARCYGPSAGQRPQTAVDLGRGTSLLLANLLEDRGISLYLL